MKIELERIRDHWTDFCNVTSIHGVRYLAATDRPLIERLWWASVLATSLYYATIYATALCKRWLDSPMEHTSVIKYESIVHIPLPAITFCNNMKDTSEKETETLIFLCGLTDYKEMNESAANVEEMIKMAPPFNCTCMFGSSLDCSKMFTRTITQNGVCYAFNMMDANEVFREGVISNYVPHHRKSTWDPDTGFTADAQWSNPKWSHDDLADGQYPIRANGNPVIDITFQNFNGSYCLKEGPGIQVMVHSPHEMPVIGHREIGWVLMNDDNNVMKTKTYTKLQYGYEYAIELDPERTWASEGLRIFKPNQRKCYFTGEKSLTFFKFYTQTNCENECLISRTINNCDCVDFYMPHFKSTRTCYTESDIECVIETMDWWGRRGKKLCNCYPSCSDINYNAFIFGKKISRLQTRTSNESLTVSVYAPDDFYMSKENKQSQWTIVDLVASCGGVFGLFCGMSLIAVVEFFYYATIRVISNFIRRRRRERLCTAN